MILDPFYPVVPDAAWVERVVRHGARLVQLRMKEFSSERRLADLRRAKAACAVAGALLVLNDFWELGLSEGVAAVHLGQGDCEGADLAALRRKDIRIGISTHDHAELDRALAMRPDYVALGPIYPTLLKVMPWAPQGLERLAEWKRLVGSVPLVAIGGITIARIAGVLAAGADSVAVVTDLVTASDPDERIADWVAATR
jgi:thiamine-phosphate pyrophosphorylase